MRASEETYRLLFDGNPMSMWLYDLKTFAFLDVNEAAIEQYGYTRDEFLRMTIKDIRPPEDLSALAENLAKGSLRIEKSGTWRHRRKNRSVIDVEIVSHDFEWDGHAARLVLATDVTQRRRAEDALRRSEAAYRSVVEEAPYGIFRATENGRMISVNQALVQILGYDSKDELMAVNARHFYRDSEARAQLVEQKWRVGRFETIEVEWKRKDRKVIRVRLSGMIARDELDGSIFDEVFVEDTTERRGLEQQLRQSQKMEAIGRLSGGIAHDFNNLLGVIIGYSELVEEQLPVGDPLRARTVEIKKAGHRAAALTRQLLAFSRQQVLEPRILNLNAVVVDVEKMLKRLIGEDIALVTGLEADLGSVKADPGQIEQVIVNLAVNARDAMPDGGTLTIETADVELDEVYARAHSPSISGAFVMLAVTDTGTGMDAETQARIFEPFFTTKELGKGTGLGLATVYGVVKQSDGHIWVYSEPGKGTTFKIYLPRVFAQAEKDVQRSAPSKIAGGTETILLVEDEEALRTLTRDLLLECKYRVIEARDGVHALELAAKCTGRIHLLLTDVVMPKLGGPALAERLLQKHPDMKVLYMSGYTGRSVVSGGLVSVESGVLPKPFTRESLTRKVREILDAKAVESSI
jgi:two-component system, cell cycle sensor histidine kinase and response regulator CckA